jgi:hypothetical protein
MCPTAPLHAPVPCADWEQQLRQYVADHPQVVVVDRLDKIRQLHNRATMLRPLQGAGILLQQVMHTAQHTILHYNTAQHTIPQHTTARVAVVVLSAPYHQATMLRTLQGAGILLQ